MEKPKTKKEAGPKLRLSYLSMRIADVRAELKALTTERQALVAKIKAEQGGAAPKARAK